MVMTLQRLMSDYSLWPHNETCRILQNFMILFLRQDKLFNTRIRFGKNARSFSNKRKPNTNKCSARTSMEYNAIT